MLSVYLDAAEASYTPLHMSPKAIFKLVLVNQTDPTKSFVKGEEGEGEGSHARWVGGVPVG